MAGGAVEDEVALNLRMDKNRLRRKHIFALKDGRKAARAATTEATNALTKEEYHFLDATTSSFSSHWFDPEYGNLLCHGMDGNAKNVEDAFRYWKSQGGHYICTGLSNRFDPEKLAEFSKIVASYNKNHPFNMHAAEDEP